MKKSIDVVLEKIQLSDGGIHLVLQTQVNDKPIKMVLDTGASHSVLDLNWVKDEMDTAIFDRAEEPAQGIGSQVEVFQLNMDQVLIGDLEMTNKRFALIDFDAINSVYRKENLAAVHGIIGGDILDEFHAEINYSKSRLRLKTKA